MILNVIMFEPYNLNPILITSNSTQNYNAQLA